jgi:hypothetical protein
VEHFTSFSFNGDGVLEEHKAKGFDKGALETDGLPNAMLYLLGLFQTESIIKVYNPKSRLSLMIYLDV